MQKELHHVAVQIRTLQWGEEKYHDKKTPLINVHFIHFVCISLLSVPLKKLGPWKHHTPRRTQDKCTAAFGTFAGILQLSVIVLSSLWCWSSQPDKVMLVPTTLTGSGDSPCFAHLPFTVCLLITQQSHAMTCWPERKFFVLVVCLKPCQCFRSRCGEVPWSISHGRRPLSRKDLKCSGKRYTPLPIPRKRYHKGASQFTQRSPEEGNEKYNNLARKSKRGNCCSFFYRQVMHEVSCPRFLSNILDIKFSRHDQSSAESS